MSPGRGKQGCGYRQCMEERLKHTWILYIHGKNQLKQNRRGGAAYSAVGSRVIAME